MASKQIKISILGKVQGVCFRSFAKQNANKLQIEGYVKNLSDGSVEIVACGDEINLEKFLKLCQSGPIFAKVDRVIVKSENNNFDKEYEFFDIRPT